MEWKYNNEGSYQENFENWYTANSLEKEQWHLPLYSREKAKQVFESFFEDKLAHSIRVNSKGRLEDVLCVIEE
tara:strand:+ start:32679 stop:32897 length:219 start_codon:yes stop_codon:yes gene_type:complete